MASTSLSRSPSGPPSLRANLQQIGHKCVCMLWSMKSIGLWMEACIFICIIIQPDPSSLIIANITGFEMYSLSNFWICGQELSAFKLLEKSCCGLTSMRVGPVFGRIHSPGPSDSRGQAGGGKAEEKLDFYHFWGFSVPSLSVLLERWGTNRQQRKGRSFLYSSEFCCEAEFIAFEWLLLRWKKNTERKRVVNILNLRRGCGFRSWEEWLHLGQTGGCNFQ